MPDGADFIIDGAQIDRAAEKLIRGYLTAGTTAVGNTTRNLERRLEAATRAAVPGKLERAWQSTAFPRSGPARNPASTIWLKGGARTRGALRFWSEPGEIRGKRGQYLAIPLPAAGSRGRGRNLTPGEWERRTGIRLRFVYRRGRSSLLVADSAVLSGKAKIARANTERRMATGRGSTTIPIFVLLPVVKFRNTVAIQPLINASDGEMAQQFFDAVRAINTTS